MCVLYKNAQLSKGLGFFRYLYRFRNNNIKLGDENTARHRKSNSNEVETVHYQLCTKPNSVFTTYIVGSLPKADCHTARKGLPLDFKTYLPGFLSFYP